MLDGPNRRCGQPDERDGHRQRHHAALLEPGDAGRDQHGDGVNGGDPPPTARPTPRGPPAHTNIPATTHDPAVPYVRRNRGAPSNASGIETPSKIPASSG